MQVYVNKISGIDDAIISMQMSKRTWSRELEEEIIRVCNNVLNRDGSIKEGIEDTEDFNKFNTWVGKLLKWGPSHITMLRFIDISVTVEGLHRAGQDDWDAHAMRFNNRIIRNSTRIKGADFGYEMSDYYKDKIIPTDIAIDKLGIDLPSTIVGHDGVVYTKAVNGYVREDMKDNNDVKRGLYMLSIPSDFTFKINLTEWGHVYKERNEKGSANPEVKMCCEAIADQIENMQPMFNRDLFMKIKN